MRKTLAVLAAMAATIIPAQVASAQGPGQQAPQQSFFQQWFGSIPSCTAAIGWNGLAAGCAQPNAGPAFFAWFPAGSGWPR